MGELLQGSGGSFIWIIVMVGFIYLMVIRPQRKQQKERTTMMDSLKKGDRVITIGGIHGIIRAIKDDKITLEVATQVYVQFSKSAVSSILKSEAKESRAAEPEVLPADEAEVEAEDVDYEIEQDKDAE